MWFSCHCFLCCVNEEISKTVAEPGILRSTRIVIVGIIDILSMPYFLMDINRQCQIKSATANCMSYALSVFWW